MTQDAAGSFASDRVARVVVVGAGVVGSTTAYALLLSGIAAEVVLVDKDKRRVEGHVQDLRDAVLFSHTTSITAGDFSDCGDAAVVIVTAGVQQTRAVRSRLDDLRENASILRDIVRELARYNSESILLIVSNPVDVLTYAAWKWSGFPSQRVIGSGTSLDTARFRRRLAERIGVSPESVHAYIIGEHGDSQVAAMSSAYIAGIPLKEGRQALGILSDLPDPTSVASATRTAGLDIIDAKGATYFGIGAAVVRITTAILRDERAVLTVSSLVPPFFGLGEVSLSLPSVVGRSGIARVLPIPLSGEEQGALRASAETLKRHIATLHNDGCF